MQAFLSNLSPVEIAIILIILFVIFGRKAFISLGRTSGETLKEIKNIKKNLSDAFEDEDKENKKWIFTGLEVKFHSRGRCNKKCLNQ